ncbi:putative Alpha/beta-Hydrolases superfamily protein [Melia azedarach]|uniref:Alpha/beta-Hydrolases superfamily protein n=1 Tax=Melia azedarach TaxID=155640 RepID=A0ACC1Y769_MELAZ|nr:putative Alpha/beta-Hydrolases superfamily protein [Melia azedarach]
MGLIPHVVEDCFGLLKLYSDGSISRSPIIHDDTPFLDDTTVRYKEFLFNEKHDLSLRLYKPTSLTSTKLPLLFYFHGGGFCFGSRTFANNHNICVRLANVLQAVIVEPDYRLAPEHRLPAALDDACCALNWLQTQAMHENVDTWLAGVDFDRVFVLGYSSGGNLAHHLAVRFGDGSNELAPVRVRGYVLLSPFFGGCIRTRSEEERPSEGIWSLEMFWRLSVPTGATQDHPLVNPFGPSSPSLKNVAVDPLLVVVGGDEILKDRAENYARKLKELEKKIAYVELAGQQHGYFIDHPLSAAAEKVIQIIKRFMADN